MAEKLGILGRKLGMTRVFASDGSAVAVTVIQAGPCPVIQVKNAETDGYNAVQIAFGTDKEKHMTKPLAGHFNKAGKGFFRSLREIRLAHVCDLLRSTGKPIDRIAALCGFAPLHLMTAFRRRYGVTRGAFRRNRILPR